MLGELRLQQLSKEVIDFITSQAGSNGSGPSTTGTMIGSLKHRSIKFVAESQGQKIFNLPVNETYDSSKDVPIVTINTVFVSNDKYTLSSNKLTFVEPGVTLGANVVLLLLSIESEELNNITKDMLSEALITELNNKANNNHTHTEYSPNVHTHQDIIDRIPQLPAISSSEQATTGLDDTTMMTPKKTKEAIRALSGDGSVIQSRVFIAGMSEYSKFTATEDTTTFTIPDMTSDKVEEIVYQGTILIKEENYTIDYNTGIVTLAFTLVTDDSLFFRTMEKSYQYGDLVGVPTIANNLTTTVEGNILDASQGKVLSDKINTLLGLQNGFKIYNTFDEIGLTEGQETMLDIAKNMANRSIAIIPIYGTSNREEYPKTNFGELLVFKSANVRVEFQYTINNATYEKYYGFSNGTVFSGWKQLVTEDQASAFGYVNLPYVNSGTIVDAIKAKISDGVLKGIFLAVDLTDCPMNGIVRYTKISDTNSIFVELFPNRPSDTTKYSMFMNNTGIVRNWITDANTEKTEISFPYREGWSDFLVNVNVSKIYKMNNQVFLSVQAKYNADIVAGDYIYIATLPIGFRPAVDIFVPAGARNSGTESFAQLVVKSAGTIGITTSQTCQAGQFINSVITYFTN